MAPVCGAISIPPVSVCHHVSTMGEALFPGTSYYHFQASGLIGSPTVPNNFSDFLLVFLQVHHPLSLMRE